MDNLSLTLSLLFAGLIIGILISLAIAAVIRGFCETIAPGSSPRKGGLIMLMIYLPTFVFLMRNMTEVAPMIVGITISSTLVSIVMLIKNIRTIKNPLPFMDAGSLDQSNQAK